MTVISPIRPFSPRVQARFSSQKVQRAVVNLHKQPTAEGSIPPLGSDDKTVYQAYVHEGDTFVEVRSSRRSTGEEFRFMKFQNNRLVDSRGMLLECEKPKSYDDLVRRTLNYQALPVIQGPNWN